jgi:hypothetical protein
MSAGSLLIPIKTLASCSKDWQVLLRSIHRFDVQAILRRPDTYLWDNWVIRDRRDARYLRYSLSAPHHVGDPSARHTHARLRVFSSLDGSTWRDHGLIVDEGLTWSGHTIQSADGSFVLLHTRSTVLDDDIHQKIAVATSSDGVRFSQPRTLIDPWDPAMRPQLEAAGYYVDSHKGLISAWRDPHFFKDILYFATKRRHPDGEVSIAIGRLRYRDADFSRAPEILSPMELPLGPEIRELEVPNMTQLSDGRYLLSVNLTDRSSPDAGSLEVNSWVRFFVGKTSEGPWTPARGDGFDARGNLFGPEDRVYGFNLLTGAREGEVAGAGFFRSGGASPHALTPFVSIRIDPP